MKKTISAKRLSIAAFTVLFLSGCSNTATVKSEIPGQLEDGGWVLNIPGQKHTHRVVLEACADQPQTITHEHTRENTTEKGLHKHNGCFVCPPKNPLVKRILQ